MVIGLISVRVLRALIAYVFLFHSNALPQAVSVAASVDTNNILIGDWLMLNVEVQHRGDVTVTWPSIVDSLKDFDVLQAGNVTVEKHRDGVVERVSFVITSFDSGTKVIPSLAFLYSGPNDTASLVASGSPIPIFVHTLAIDTTQSIKDVKPPLGVPLSFAEILPYFAAILGLAGAAWLAYFFLKKRRKGVELLTTASLRPPHEIALEALQALRAERLWQRGKVKEYHTRLADIIRTYIEQRFDVTAMEMTTEEILTVAALRMFPAKVRDNLVEILYRADLVKFAKFQPLPEEHESSFDAALAFVESTGPKDSQPPREESVGRVEA